MLKGLERAFSLWLAGWLGVALDLLAFPETFSIGARVEKCRRGDPVKSLLFIGIADTANFYWCPMKSLLSNIDTEPLYFMSYLHDRLLYSLKLGYVKTLPRDVEKLLSIGDEIRFNDIEKLLREQIHDDSEKPPSFVIFSTFTSEGPTKCMVLNPSLSPAVRDKLEKLAKKKHINIVSLDEIPPKLRGEICEDFLAESARAIVNLYFLYFYFC